MVRGLVLAGAFAIGSAALGRADELPGTKPGTRQSEPITAEVVEAQLDIRKAYAKAAEVALAAAKKKHDRVERARVAGTVAAEDVEQAKIEVDTAAAQLDIRKAEVREAELRLKLANNRPAAAPAAVQTIAAFNMARVMRDFDKAKYQVYLLNQKRLAQSGDLGKWRAEYAQLQADSAKAVGAKEKDEISRRMVVLSRQIEDKDREVNKMLNDDASGIISQLYDDIKGVVDDLAETNKYQIVFAYPDAVTPEEHKNPMLKELKLKPPAAHPFFVAKPVDITTLVLERLNTLCPPLDAQGRKVDVSKLPQPAPPTIPVGPRD